MSLYNEKGLMCKARIGKTFQNSSVSVECRFPLREIRVLCAAEGPTIIVIYNGSNPLIGGICATVQAIRVIPLILPLGGNMKSEQEP